MEKNINDLSQKKLFTQIPSSLLLDKGISMGSKLVYAYLYYLSESGHMVSVSRENIRTNLKISHSSLTKYLIELDTAGYITRKQCKDKDNQFLINTYTLSCYPSLNTVSNFSTTENDSIPVSDFSVTENDSIPVSEIHTTEDNDIPVSNFSTTENDSIPVSNSYITEDDDIAVSEIHTTKDNDIPVSNSCITEDKNISVSEIHTTERNTTGFLF